MNALTLRFAQRPALLVMVAIVALILLVLGGVLAARRRKQAILPGLAGFGLAGFAALVLIRHPFLLGRDADNLERLTGLELSAQPPSIDDWPQWRGVNRDGIGRAQGLNTDWNKSPPPILWNVPVGNGYSSFAVVGDRVYTQDYSDGKERVICLNAPDGKLRWAYSYPVDYSGFRLGYSNGPRATPTVDDGRVYAVGATGKFLCLDADPSDGKAKLLWEHDLLAEFDGKLPGWGVACSPLIDGENVIVQPGGPKGSIAAFARKTGKLAWAALDDASGYSSPMVAVLAGKRQIIAFTATRLVGLESSNGAELWSFDWPTAHSANIATPIVTGNAIFISTGYGTGSALLTLVEEGGALKAVPVFVRRNKLLRTHHMTAVLHEGHLYGFDDIRGDMKCIDIRNPAGPKEAWDSRGIDKGALILVNGYLIVQTQNGSLALVKATPKEYQPRGKIANLLAGSETWALPVLSRGKLYVRDHEKIVCLRLAEESPVP